MFKGVWQNVAVMSESPGALERPELRVAGPTLPTRTQVKEVSQLF